MTIPPLGLRTIVAGILSLSLFIIYLCTPSYRSATSPSSNDANSFGVGRIPGFKSNAAGAPTTTTTAMNDTLGFQEILLISMDYRTDRQDALALMAAETGLKLKLIPGVSTIPAFTRSRLADDPSIPWERIFPTSLSLKH
jgi:hypothetical protein